MGRRRSRSARKSTPAGRVAIVCKDLFGDSPAEMAASTKVSLSALYNVLSGRRDPGRSMLLAIAQHPQVDAAWLLTGKRAGLPVALQPLPGSPRAYRRLLDGATHPVAESLSAPTRYWLALREKDLNELPAELSLHVGDLLLLETSKQEWGDDGSRAIGRPCVVQIDATEGTKLALRQITATIPIPDGDRIQCHFIAAPSSPSAVTAPFISLPLEQKQNASKRKLHDVPCAIERGLLVAVPILVERTFVQTESNVVTQRV